MTVQRVLGEKKGNLFYLTFNRPEKRNAISFQMLEDINNLIDPVAMEILMTANRYPAQQALDWGLVNYLYPTKEALFEGAEKLAQDIIKTAPLPVGAFKKIIKRGEGIDLMTHLDMEASLQSIMIRSEDFQEGVNALIEGRDPQWKRK
jgi:enoyl-CoA hydratase